jgi:hypothetical protein
MSDPLNDFITQAEAAYNEGCRQTDDLFNDITAKLARMEEIRLKINRIAPILGKELRPETTLRTIPVGTVTTPQPTPGPNTAKTGIPGSRVPRSATIAASRRPRPMREPSVGKLREASGDEDQGFEKDE